MGSMRNVARVGGVKRRGGGGEGEIPDPFRRLLRKLWVMVAWLPRLFMGSFRFGRRSVGLQLPPKYLATYTCTPRAVILLSSKASAASEKVKLCKFVVKWKRGGEEKKGDGPRSPQLCRSRQRALDFLWLKRKIRDCSQSIKLEKKLLSQLPG